MPTKKMKIQSGETTLVNFFFLCLKIFSIIVRLGPQNYSPLQKRSISQTVTPYYTLI